MEPVKLVVYYCNKCGRKKDVLQSKSIGGQFACQCSECGREIRRYIVRYEKLERPNRPVETCNVDILHRDNPRWSDALGVGPGQSEEFKKTFPQLDLEFDNEGRCLVRSRAHKKQIMKARGFAEV